MQHFLGGELRYREVGALADSVMLAMSGALTARRSGRFLDLQGREDGVGAGLR